MSGYAVTAQFYDAMAGDQHAALHEGIAEALKGLDTAGHPVVDIGAGTGLSTQIIAKILPEAEIFAIEPDPAMRSALMARVWSDPDLRRRVSILPHSALSAPLPPVISVAVASASLVHFNPQQRLALWALFSRRLSPSGCAVIEIQCPVAQDLPEMCMATAQVGHVTYEGWASAERVDDQRQRWHLRYVSWLHGVQIDHQNTDYICWVVSAEQVLAEAHAFGLVGEATDTLVLLRPNSSPH